MSYSLVLCPERLHSFIQNGALHVPNWRKCMHIGAWLEMEWSLKQFGNNKIHPPGTVLYGVQEFSRVQPKPISNRMIHSTISPCKYVIQRRDIVNAGFLQLATYFTLFSESNTLAWILKFNSRPKTLCYL